MKKLIIIPSILFMLILTGCENFVDKSHLGTVSVKLSDNGSQRYIAGGYNSVDEAVLGFIEEDVLYNFNSTEDIKDFNGEYVFSGIPVGKYAFLAVLLSDDKNISTAIQNVEIEAGFNDLYIDMGPGFELVINGESLKFNDLTDKFLISFKDDVINIRLLEENLTNPMIIGIETNAFSLEIKNLSGTSSSGFSVDYTPPLTETSFSTGTVSFDGTSQDGLQMILGSFDGSKNIYKIQLKGR